MREARRACNRACRALLQQALCGVSASMLAMQTAAPDAECVSLRVRLRMIADAVRSVLQTAEHRSCGGQM